MCSNRKKKKKHACAALLKPVTGLSLYCNKTNFIECLILFLLHILPGTFLLKSFPANTWQHWLSVNCNMLAEAHVHADYWQWKSSGLSPAWIKTQQKQLWRQRHIISRCVFLGKKSVFVTRIDCGFCQTICRHNADFYFILVFTFYICVCARACACTFVSLGLNLIVSEIIAG